MIVPKRSVGTVNAYCVPRFNEDRASDQIRKRYRGESRLARKPLDINADLAPPAAGRAISAA